MKPRSSKAVHLRSKMGFNTDILKSLAKFGVHCLHMMMIRQQGFSYILFRGFEFKKRMLVGAPTRQELL